MFYTICPLCQNVCKIKEIDKSIHPSSVDGVCRHPEENFFYSFIKNNVGAYLVDMHSDHFSVSLDTCGKKSTINDLYENKKYKLDFLISINWNSFSLEEFENQIKQIIKLHIFK